MIKPEDLKANLVARALVLNNDLKRYKTLVKEDKFASSEDKNTALINVLVLQGQKELLDQIVFEIDDEGDTKAND